MTTSDEFTRHRLDRDLEKAESVAREAINRLMGPLAGLANDPEFVALREDLIAKYVGIGRATMEFDGAVDGARKLCDAASAYIAAAEVALAYSLR